MSEEKRKVKVRMASSYFYDIEKMLMIDLELPALTEVDRAKLAKAKHVMDTMEQDAPNRRALAQLELYEKANRAEKAEKELAELKEAYRIYVRDYTALLEECTRQKVQLEYMKRPFWLRIKDLFR